MSEMKSTDPRLPGLADGEYYCLYEREKSGEWVPTLIHNPGPHFISNHEGKRKYRMAIVRLRQVLEIKP